MPALLLATSNPRPLSRIVSVAAVVVANQLKPDFGSLGVSRDVIQRLLSDPVEGNLNVLGKVHLAIDFQLNGDLRSAGGGVCQLLKQTA